MYKSPAIVFGGGINGLGLIRNLGRNGVDVYCVVDKTDEAVYSKYCKKHFLVPHIEEEKGILRSFLNKLRKKLPDYGLLFSTTDLFSLHLSDLKDELEGNYHVLLPDIEVVRTLVNKREFYQSLSKHNIPCPITYFPKSSEDVREIGKEIKYPVFIRPSVSQVFARVFHKKGFLANSANELMNYYGLLSRFKIDALIQEVISGPANNICGIAGYFNRKSLPKALFAYRRLRGWPPIFGTNTLIESIPISDITSLKETTETYLHQLGYYGIMEAEFKRDAQDGIFKLLEINARSWWQNSFPTKCGINIAFISYLDSIGKELKFNEDYEVGIKWVFLLNDLRSLIEKGQDMTLREWISSLYGIKDWAYFSVDDPVPWIVSPLFNLRTFFYRRKIPCAQMNEDKLPNKIGKTISQAILKA